MNRNLRCLKCSGTLAPVTNCGITKEYISLPIEKDKMIIRYCYHNNNEIIRKDIDKININFCPYCGCKLRKKIDWSLCD